MPYTLDNAEERAAQAPRSFFIPPAEIRHGLVPGDLVKLIFHLEREDGETAVERMWVEVIQTGPYAGTLANQPHLEGVLAHGDRVEFGPEHVCAYEYSAAQLGYPTGETVFLPRRLVEEDRPPEWLLFGDDGAWQAFLGDETEEELGDPQRVLRWELGYLTDHFPSTEVALRDAYASPQPPFGVWWRRQGDGYVRDER